MKFSIIIPFKAVNAYVRETVPYVLKRDNADWELILVPNEDMTSELFGRRERTRFRDGVERTVAWLGG
ncbi:MAG: hypothetical protein A2V88_07045 [Elusimicrobia bacterium RBG_16_66_12]|nr:MAG: hypothetical protein A2V88_07045 [Elusimicrobia bacterium RBG_16_66_12]